jgi:multiple sugar transport system permease protein
VRRFPLYLFLALMLIPFWLLISVSFRTGYEPIKIPRDLVPAGSLVNYQRIISEGDLSRWAVNTLIVALGTVAGTVGTSALAGYAFAVHRFAGRNAALVVLSLLMVVPHIVTVIPVFVMFRTLGIATGPVAAILPSTLSVVGVFFFKAHIELIPREIIESARIDGAGEFRVMWKVIFPQCLPVAGFIALTTGIGSLNDFLWQLLTMRKAPTIIVGLVQVVQNLRSTVAEGGAFKGPGLPAAVGVFIFVPSLMIYLATNRLFTYGLSTGGMR